MQRFHRLTLSVGTMLVGLSFAMLSPSVQADDEPRSFREAAEEAGINVRSSQVRLFEQGITSLEGIQEYDQATSMTLYGNRLTTIEPGTFDGMSNLEMLWLNRNYYTTLGPNLFDEMSNLGLLHLNDNDLATVDANLFAGLDSLYTLHLGGNQFTELDAALFAGLDRLEILHLGGNLLTTLEADFFSDLGGLHRLSLADNRFATLDSNLFAGMSNLQMLALSDNLFTSIHPELFDGLSSLEELQLAGNEIDSITPDHLDDLVCLRKIYLNHNHLTSLDPALFVRMAEVETLLLDHNRLTGQLNLANLPLQSLKRFGARVGNNFTSVNLSGASLSQESMMILVGDLSGGGVVNLDLTDADLTNVSDYSSLAEWADLETLTLTGADYSIFTLDGWIDRFESLHTITMSEEQYMLLAMADSSKLIAWEFESGHQLNLVPAAE